MKEKKKTNEEIEQNSGNNNMHISASVALDDEQRVKVLSPGMLVTKRFLRNKLAMVGFVILVVMFVFSFVGGLFMPYSEAQVFRKTENVLKDYAVMSENMDYLYTTVEGMEFPSIAGAKMILAANKGEETFVAKDVTYGMQKIGEDFYQIFKLSPVYNLIILRGKSDVKPLEKNGPVEDAVVRAFEVAEAEKEGSFFVGDVEYFITKTGKTGTISIMEEVALASKTVFAAEETLSHEFKKQAEIAIQDGVSFFAADSRTYDIVAKEKMFLIKAEGNAYATASTYSIQPVGSGNLPLSFVQKAQEAVTSGTESFSFSSTKGQETAYTIEKKSGQYRIRSQQMTQLNDSYATPSKTHLLGTDGNGMDVLTRLMYGGRISLMIGFIAIAIEIFIGVIVGGLAGYFGKWVDTILMRFVDIVICIPALPLYIIVGSVMDYYQIDPRVRIYMLCAILGMVSWPSIARMVRGQILSFREQEFMTATEATGIRISRRIFKHLIPNVIPNLIVIATMGLGEIILMEATLSFLGLGVKFPFASWGNIINSVNDVYVMQNYLFVWVPAGFLILITVLGFNFVGDGLRDAFDPKMKR